jgi:hypothetical protein
MGTEEPSGKVTELGASGQVHLLLCNSPTGSKEEDIYSQ